MLAPLVLLAPIPYWFHPLDFERLDNHAQEHHEQPSHSLLLMLTLKVVLTNSLIYSVVSLPQSAGVGVAFRFIYRMCY